MYTVLETIPLTTASHTAAGVAVWIERDQLGWHAYMTTPQIENQYISSRFYETSLDDLKTMAVECADQAVLDLTPKTPVKPKAAKKARKTTKRQPICQCPTCAPRVDTGVFYCLLGREYVVYNSGQFLGIRPTHFAGTILLDNHRYTSLTKHAA